MVDIILSTSLLFVFVHLVCRRKFVLRVDSFLLNMNNAQDVSIFFWSTCTHILQLSTLLMWILGWAVAIHMNCPHYHLCCNCCHHYWYSTHYLNWYWNCYHIFASRVGHQHWLIFLQFNSFAWSLCIMAWSIPSYLEFGEGMGLFVQLDQSCYMPL